jgi:hypothetical protein
MSVVYYRTLPSSFWVVEGIRQTELVDLPMTLHLHLLSAQGLADPKGKLKQE